MKTCKFNNNQFSEGSLICKDENEYICLDGEWSYRANQCGGDCDFEPVIREPSEESESCYYNNRTYGHLSRICQNGIAMVCDNGKWYNGG